MPSRDAQATLKPWVPLLAVALVASIGFALVSGS